VLTGLWHLAVAPSRVRTFLSRRAVAGLAALAIAGAALWGAFRYAPWWIAQERLTAGEAAMIESGWRDAPFFPDGWSDPHGKGNVTVRASLAPIVDIRLPLLPHTDHDLTIRMDPPDRPGLTATAAIFVNRHHLGDVALVSTEGRMGSYRFSIPADLVEGANRLRIMAPTLVPAGQAGPQFAFLPPDQLVGLRLWYVRVVPRRR
jgi:hypothetical protein